MDYLRAYSFVTSLGQKLGMDTWKAALGVLEVANANMEKAIRVITVERGVDPRGFTLVAFGGAGPLHACELAERLDIPRVLVPRYPGVLSALGMLAADVMKDYAQTVMWPLPGAVEGGFVRQIATGFRSLAVRGWQEMTAEGFDRQTTQVLTALDMRYVGQSHELVVPFDELSTADLAGRFQAAHKERFGYNLPDEQVEIVNLRLKMLGRVQRPTLQRELPDTGDASKAVLEERTVWFQDPMPTKVYSRELLHAGHLFAGPAIVVQMDATTAVPPGWKCQVDVIGSLILDHNS